MHAQFPALCKLFHRNCIIKVFCVCTVYCKYRLISQIQSLCNFLICNGHGCRKCRFTLDGYSKFCGNACPVYYRICTYFRTVSPAVYFDNPCIYFLCLLVKCNCRFDFIAVFGFQRTALYYRQSVGKPLISLNKSVFIMHERIFHINARYDTSAFFNNLMHHSGRSFCLHCDILQQNQISGHCPFIICTVYEHICNAFIFGVGKAKSSRMSYNRGF